VLWRMGRVTRVLLLAFAVAVLSAAPGQWGGGEDAAGSPRAEVADPSQQLSSGLPIARSAGAKLTGIDDDGSCDRSDQRTRHVPVAVVPAEVVPSRSAVSELAGESIEMRVETVAMCACGRGPPRVSLLTSI